MLRKVFGIQSLLWLALTLALVGSLRHVAWGFSTLEQGDIVAGYIQAVAVDLGLFALAIGIQQRRRQKRGTGVLWIGVLLFAGLSTYANLLHGVQFKSDIDLGKWTSNVTIMSWLDFMRPVLLSGVLPLLVVYLSEIAGSDTSYAIQEAQKERRKADSLAKPSSTVDTLALANVKRSESAEAAIASLLSFYSQYPTATQGQAGEHCQRSRQWVSGQLRELEAQGQLKRNGEGVIVTQ